MADVLLPRSTWTTSPVEGDGDDPIVFVDITLRDGFIVHWDGGATPTTVEGEKALLRAYEAYHRSVAGGEAGALKYNLAVGPISGNVYEGRGLSVRGMHTGGANTPNIGCILIGGPGNLTEAARDGLRSAYRIAAAYVGRELAHRVHSDLNETSCPGPEIRAFVHAGGLTAADAPHRKKEGTMYVKGTTAPNVYSTSTDANGNLRLRHCPVAETAYAHAGGLVITGDDATLTRLGIEGQYTKPYSPDVDVNIDFTPEQLAEIASQIKPFMTKDEVAAAVRAGLTSVVGSVGFTPKP